MRNSTLIFAIAIGGAFLNGGVLEARTVTCKVFSPTDFREVRVRPGEYTHNWWYWDPESRKIEISFNRKMEGVDWYGSSLSEARGEPKKLTQIPYPVARVSPTGTPVCTYHFKFDDEKEGMEIQVGQFPPPKFHNCRVTGQTTFDCEERH
jgi:hypothetical protein